MKPLLLTSAILLSLGLSACSEQKTAQQLLTSAQQYSEQGKYGNAIIDYKNAVRLSPKDSNARLGLGRAYLNQGNYISAEKELERAVKLGAKFETTALFLVQVKTRLNKFSEVEALVKASEDLNDDDYLIILTFAGMSALIDGQAAKSQDYFSQAIALNEDAEYSILAKAYLLYSERKRTEALTLVSDVLAKNNDFTEALRLQGYLFSADKDYVKASDAFERYSAIYPQDYNIQFLLVNALIRAELFEQADTYNNKLLKRFNKSPLALQYKSQILYNAKNYEEARNFASQAISIEENFFIAKMIAGISSYKLDELEQAYDYLIGLEDFLPVTHPVNVILLSVKIKLGHTDDLSSSVARLEAIQNSDSDVNLLEVTSTELVKIGDYANAESLINKVANISPNNAIIKAKQGILLLNQGDISGIHSLEQAVSIDPSLHETEFALAQQYLKGDQVNKAQVIATKWLNSESYKVSGFILSGMIASKQENVVAAEGFFNEAIAIETNNLSALYSLAAVYEFKQQTEMAIELYKKVIGLNPNHHSAIKRYSVLKSQQGKVTEAISFLSALYDKSKLNSTKVPKNLVIGLAQVLIVSGQNKEGITLLEGLKIEKNLPVQYWSVLTATYEINKQIKRALSTYEEAVKMKPHNYSLRVNYIALLDKQRQYQKALTVAVEANKYFANNDNLQRVVAYLDLATEANQAMTSKDYILAIDLYEKIYNNTPNKYSVINLARALEFSQQTAKAEAILEKFLIENNAQNQVRMLLAELYIKHNDEGVKTSQIINTYQKMLTIEPERLDVLNNLAWQQYLASDITNSQKNIERAVGIAPKNLMIQESYGVILVAAKDYGRAIEVITAAIEKGAVDVNAHVGLAEAYIAINKKEKAKEVLAGLSAHDSEVNLKITKLKQQISSEEE